MQEALPTTYDELAKSYIALQASNSDLIRRMEFLEEQLRLAFRSRFGASSESIIHPGMRPLFEEVESLQAEQDDKETEVKSYKRKPGRKPFPESLPRIDVFCDLSEEEKICSCCNEQMQKTHEKTSEKVEVIPAKVQVKRFITPVFACKKCEQAKQARLPYHPIPKCSVTTETLAHIAVSKYIDGLPLHRQEKIFERYGIEIGRDKMSRWMILLDQKLSPLVDILQKQLFNGHRMGMDETSIQVLKEEGRRPDQKSYMFVQAREGPPGRKITIFKYEKSRASYVFQDYLKDFKGSLITDGLQSYQTCLDSLEGINHGGCMSHARRKFADAVKGKKSRSAIAKKIILLMKELYRIEKEIENKNSAEILVIRQKESTPIMEQIKAVVIENIDKIPRQSLTGKALHYLKNQWELLIKFLKDPNLPIHNNYVERQIRPFAIGRRAWLFADTEAGAHASATFYSLLNTAKENGLDPFKYLVNVLSKLEKAEDLETLLPFNPVN